MLRQILGEAQKPVFTSEFTDNSTAAGIYQDLITNSLADSMSKSGTLGMAKIFEQQLSHPAGKTTATAPVSSTSVSSTPTPNPHRKILGHPFLYPVSPSPHE
jgi:Rod binding domain-containing protein